MPGLPRSIIKKYGVTKKAWAVFRGRKSKSRRKNPSRRTKTRKRSVRRMARRYRRMARRYRRKRRGGGGKSMTRTVFKLIRLGALAAPAIGIAMKPTTGEDKVHLGIRAYTGYHTGTGEWKFQWLAEGWLPYLGACIATYGIPKLTSIIRRL